jgi:hypothetical protein
MLPRSPFDILKEAAISQLSTDELAGESGWEKSLDREMLNADDTPERAEGPFLHATMDYENGGDWVKGQHAAPSREQPYEDDDYRSQSDAPPWFQMLGS